MNHIRHLPRRFFARTEGVGRSLLPPATVLEPRACMLLLLALLVAASPQDVLTAVQTGQKVPRCRDRSSPKSVEPRLGCCVSTVDTLQI